MARGVITVTQIGRASAAPPAQVDADSTNKHQFANNEKTFVEIVSSDGGSQTVSIPINPTLAATTDGITVPPKVITIPAGGTRLAGPFPAAKYNQNGNVVYLDPSVSTTLKFRVYTV